MPKFSKGAHGSASPNRMMLRRTLFLLVVCGIVAFIVLAGRLYKLQITDHDKYESAAVEQQVRETTVSAARGTIYDRNRKILAMSATVSNIYISPAEIKMYGEDINLIASNLSRILGVDYQSIVDKAQDTKSWYKTLSRKVEDDITDQVREFKEQYNLKGVKIENDSKRYYPYSSLACHVVGFVGTDNYGLSGLELRYNEELTGTEGRVVRATNSAGTDLLFSNYEDYFDAVDGSDMVTTIDATVQYYVKKHLQQAVEDYDVRNGAGCLVMNVKTGEIVAMVSLGDFDLNDYQTVSAADQEAIDAEEDEEKKSEMLTAAQQKQWRNKTISDTYEPGSTFKIITLAMALEEGVINKNDSFYCGGSLDVLGRTEPVHCWKTYGHGAQTLTQAIQHSCNIALVNIGQKVGAEKFYEYAEAFGFFEYYGDSSAQLTGKTGIDLGGEAGSIWWSKDVFTDKTNLSQLCSASFGQTFNITPIQLITAVSACANGGHLMKPYLVKEIIGEDGTTIQKNEPTEIRQVISEETSKTICEILEQVVCDPKEGTGKNAYVAGYRIGGKTGTSTNTTVEATTGRKQYIVSFIGIAPADDPQYAVLVMLDSPSSESGIYVSGGQMAAPTAGKIFADILPYLGVEPEYTDSEAQISDKRVPNVKGMTIEEAKAAVAAEGLTCRVIGDGSEVTQQLPRANVVIASSSEVLLYAGAEPSEEKEVVPELTGLSYSIARQRLGALGLYISSTNGSASESATVVISRQNIEAGTEVKHGTVITVTLVDNDASIYGRY